LFSAIALSFSQEKIPICVNIIGIKYKSKIDLLQNRKKPHPNPPRRFGEGAEKPGISPPLPRGG